MGKIQESKKEEKNELNGFSWISRQFAEIKGL